VFNDALNALQISALRVFKDGLNALQVSCSVRKTFMNTLTSYFVGLLMQNSVSSLLPFFSSPFLAQENTIICFSHFQVTHYMDGLLPFDDHKA